METVSQKGNKCILFKNNKFYKVYAGKKSDSYRCTIRTCKARIQVDNNGKIINENVVHKHKEKVLDVELDNFKNTCKRKAEANIDVRPSKLVRNELDLVDTSNFTFYLF